MTPARKRPLLLLRAEASPALGSGHLMRCRALGDAWRHAGGVVEIATASDLAAYAAWLGDTPIHRLAAGTTVDGDAVATWELAAARGADWIAADGYRFDSAWQAEVTKHARLLLFDDYGHGAPHHAHLVLNQNPGADPLRYVSANPRTRRLLGPRFAVLREGFARWRGWLHAQPARARRLLVTFGGSDPARLTLRAVQALREIRDLEVEIVLAAEHPDAAEIARLCANSALRLHHRVTEMPELIAGCDFALTAAGSTTLECAFLQTPQLLVTVAENQRPLAAGLVAGGAAELLGWHTEVTAAAITEAVSSLRDDLERRTAMSRAAARLVDGFGSARVVAQMRGDLLSLRSATGPDDRLVFGWANDPASRAASFASEEIPWETHRDWFARRLADPATRLWIGDDERGPIGVVRFDLAAEEATISINLAPEARGFGFGSALIARASRELIASTATRRIHAFIKPGNHASVAAFIAADYEQLAATTQREQPAEHFAFPAAA